MLSLDENQSYLAAKGEAEEGQTMGAILPVLFLLIAVLTMITTMHRITKHEKTQIGTLKALGFKDKTILAHYTSFGLFIGVVGCVILIVAALGLGIVVLYNLGVMSYTERFREFSTLKVVGFKDKQISKLLISQNVWLTVIGTLLGLPAGFGVLYWIIKALAGEYELKVLVHFSSYLIAILLTFGVSILVGLLISKKNKHIDMVEALKDKEC